MRNKKLQVVEIFHSIQGEGANTGMSAIFIRLAGCNKRCSFCDTDFDTYREYNLEEILQHIQKYKCRNIIWTGGEPTLQLTEEILSHFDGYYNCIETNGSRPVPKGIDYISCSPKVGLKQLNEVLTEVDEIRFACELRTQIPAIESLPKAKHYFLSPIFEGEPADKMQFSRQNLNKCLEEIHRDNRWRLSIQLHKFLQIQ